jgi:AraC-like DNA-binding protein
MADDGPVGDIPGSDWVRADSFDDFAGACCDHPHLSLLKDSEELSLTQRVGQVGAVTLSDIIVGSDLSMGGGELCSHYRVLVVESGRTEFLHRGVSVIGGAGSAAVYAPEGLSSARWATGSKLICCRIPRSALDAALSGALGRHVTAGSDFQPSIPITAEPSRNWINMLLVLRDQFARPNSLLNHALVGRPFVDSLLRGFLLAAEHPHRDALLGRTGSKEPRVIRAAVEIIEEQADLPLTVSTIAARCHISTRSLQQAFRRHLATTPMAYLREVRLSRAHECLLESDPSIESVTSIAYRWGFTNLGRFAAAHESRYHEPPSATLRRSASPHGTMIMRRVR